MDKQIFISLIDKFLSGKARPEEMDALANYYHSFQQSGSSWDEAVLGDAEEMESRLLNRLNIAIARDKAVTEAEGNEEIPVAELPETTTRKSWKKIAIAASVAGILIVSGYALKDFIKGQVTPVKTIVVATEKGMRRHLVLPDSTQVWLEGGSSFSYPDAFREEERTVNLQGEAFFEVAQDAGHPFVIQTPLLSTRVLSTSFNVKAYDLKKAEVVVVTGKVMVKEGSAAIQNDNAQQLVVRSNHKVSYDSIQRVLEMKDAPDAADFAQRRNGKFIYRGVKVADMIKDLQQAYNTPIAIKKELLNCTFYGDFNAKDDVQKVLHLIALSLNGRVENMGERGYFITGEGCL
ncbi:ferric-dicitrate binding protein FerR (iron transport regulator) [Filimonas zeae]|uniref:FecR family protein n=1 Tax=Filimonas zeae TaxID=1737353 RepID=A0A917MV59_9BACT|nr:FecR domain-containing protein [Filimonas zeae]MDR6338236.1 ferric-dicitrate binding protein FerR (iron transport regulator) [Filimonas zeae]GGH62397.1 hypothetical protein GCM10011379_12320 [Filimonas zeae]